MAKASDDIHATGGPLGGLTAAWKCDFCYATPPAIHAIDVPDFEMPGGIGRSTGGWAACDACKALLDAGARARLLARATDGFTVAGKPSAGLVTQLHATFWHHYDPDLLDWIGFKGTADGVSDGSIIDSFDTIALEYALTPEQAERLAHRLGKQKTDIEKVQSVLATFGYPSLVHRAHVFDRLTDRAAAGFQSDLSTWLKCDPHRWCTPDEIAALDAALRHVLETTTARKRMLDAERDQILSELRRLEREMGVRPALSSALGMPPWQAAVEMQFAALRTLAHITEALATKDHRQSVLSKFDQFTRAGRPAAITNDLAVNWMHDIGAMRLADAYCWMDPALDAVRQAAASAPADAPLHWDQLPKGNGQGWWWFAPPLPVQTHSQSSEVAALLWSLSTRMRGDTTVVDVPDEAAAEAVSHLVFTAYTLEEFEGRVTPTPSTMWRWRFGETLDQMLLRCGEDHDAAYGPGGPWEHEARFDQDKTLAAVRALSLFFLAACVWVDQEILLVRPEHIERHQRKRLVREHQLAQAPQLRVIALRQAHYDRPADGTPPGGEHEARKYDNFQWVVSGHWRNQPYGPGHTGRRLKYIFPFVKGPEGKPLRTKQKVFAVVR